ncbi:hypothetical protein AAG570_003093 [Ranatra chinensis]|uniref:Uncharacterized protein n=1 Tax=Ranatra chinensis TaxID=642074 RepID=A0ABD0Y6D8_9HEMI
MHFVIEDGYYWQRFAEERWPEDIVHPIWRCRNSWKRLALERYLGEFLGDQEPGYIDYEEVASLCSMVTPFVRRLVIRGLKPPRFVPKEPEEAEEPSNSHTISSDDEECSEEDEIPDRLDMRVVLANLPKLRELSMEFGMMNYGPVGSCPGTGCHQMALISPQDAERLGRGLASLGPSLQNVTIHRSQLRDTQLLRNILTPLFRNIFLHTVDLCYCGITNDGAEVIANVLLTSRKPHPVVCLRLKGNKILTRGACLIGKALAARPSPALKTINMTSNRIKSQGGREYSEREISTNGIISNMIGFPFPGIIAGKLQKFCGTSPPELEVLSLSKIVSSFTAIHLQSPNAEDGVHAPKHFREEYQAVLDGKRVFAEMLMVNTNLEEVILAGCELDDDAGVKLANCLLSNSRLLTLSMACNSQLTNKTARAALDALERNRVIQWLDFRGCGFHPDTMADFKDILYENRERARTREPLPTRKTFAQLQKEYRDRRKRERRDEKPSTVSTGIDSRTLSESYMGRLTPNRNSELEADSEYMRIVENKKRHLAKLSLRVKPSRTPKKKPTDTEGTREKEDHKEKGQMKANYGEEDRRKEGDQKEEVLKEVDLTGEALKEEVLKEENYEDHLVQAEEPKPDE